MYIEYYASDGSIKTLGDNELAHFNHNHDAFGRFTSSSGSRTRAAKRGLNKLYRLDKKANKHFARQNRRYLIAGRPRRAYHRLRYDEFGRGKIGRFLIPGTSASKKAERYAKKLQNRIGDYPVDDLNSRQLYAGRKYCMRFVN